MKFIHLADCHLGYYQYGLKERAEDFMKNFTYIMKQECDFFLISGDFFHHRQVDANTIHYAVQALQKNNTPIYVIPGNHDKSLKGGMSWLQYMGKSGHINLIENNFVNHNSQIKIFGFNTYDDFLRYLDEHKRLPITKYNIMMLHEGVEGYIPGEGLTIEQLQVIKDEGIDYLALGHIHSPYDIGGWIYNPGSLERTSISDSVGGAYIKTDDDMKFKRYDVRPMHKISINVANKTDEEIKEEIKGRTIKMNSESIVSIKFEGKVDRIFNAKDFTPDGVFHVMITNETSMKNSEINIKDSEDIENEIIRQMTNSRPDVRNLIFKMLDLVNISDNVGPEEIMDLIKNIEGDE